MLQIITYGDAWWPTPAAKEVGGDEPLVGHVLPTSETKVGHLLPTSETKCVDPIFLLRAPIVDLTMENSLRTIGLHHVISETRTQGMWFFHTSWSRVRYPLWDRDFKSDPIWIVWQENVLENKSNAITKVGKQSLKLLILASPSSKVGYSQIRYSQLATKVLKRSTQPWLKTRIMSTWL